MRRLHKQISGTAATLEEGKADEDVNERSLCKFHPKNPVACCVHTGTWYFSVHNRLEKRVCTVWLYLMIIDYNNIAQRDYSSLYI